MATKVRKVVTAVMRVVALAAMVVAVVVMVTAKETAHVLNLSFTAKYTNTPAFKYYVVAEAIAAAYTLIALFLSSKSLLWRLVVILDVVVALLLTSSISAALAIAMVGKHGNSHAGWLPICGQVPHFCDKQTVSLVAGFVAAVAQALLLVYSLRAALSPVFAIKP
ncbi:CASP-like protein 1C2 [Linum grandiflorum]